MLAVERARAAMAVAVDAVVALPHTHSRRVFDEQCIHQNHIFRVRPDVTISR
jgi:hypothetical protein